MFPAIVRDDLSGADPEHTAAASSAYLCYPVLVLSERKTEVEGKKERRWGGRDRERQKKRGMTSCASPSGPRFFNGHKLKLNLYGEERGKNRIVKRQQYF